MKTKRVIRYGYNDDYQEEVDGACRYYTGNNIYAYPRMIKAGGIVSLIDIDLVTRSENLIKRMLLVDPKVDNYNLDKINPALEVVEFSYSRYEKHYAEEHQKWHEERLKADPLAYDDFDAMERY